MKGTARRRVTGAVATVAVTGALVLGGAGAASAIQRAACSDPAFLWLSSPNTTCWAYAGTAYVTLYDVYGLSSGNNAGYIYGQSIYSFFPKWAASAVTQRTITTVHID